MSTQRQQPKQARQKAKKPVSLDEKVRKLLAHQEQAKELGIPCSDAVILKQIKASI